MSSTFGGFNELITLPSEAQSRLHALVRELKFDWEISGDRLQGRFFYLKFSDRLPAQRDLVAFLYQYIIYYCLPYAEIQDAEAKYLLNNDLSVFQDLADKARRLFVRAREQESISGEPSELLLFALLELVIAAPQVVSKMGLKTSGMMHFHGVDGIHAKLDDDGETLILLWGEAKAHKGFSSALNDALDSITNFHSVAGTGVPRERELQIVHDHFSLATNDLAIRKKFFDYLDPYSNRTTEKIEAHACLLCFDFGIYETIATGDKSKIEDEFKDRYERRVATAKTLIENKVSGHPILEDLNLWFFLFPFKSIDDFRNEFNQRLT
ncbi:MAG: DUF1837 domain-containing protein [Pseudomonadota bacterium]